MFRHVMASLDFEQCSMNELGGHVTYTEKLYCNNFFQELEKKVCMAN